jgi:hypothetical protein
MAERKYDKYFISYERTQREMEQGIRPFMICNLDDTVMKGCHFYSASWVFPNSFGQPNDSEPGKYKWYAGHPPHIHKYAELLFHIGTNPDDPSDLGAEVVIYMGPELERHVFTQSTVVYIPPNFIHCPWSPIRTWRPWIFIEINQGLMHTEKRYWQVLPEEIVAKMDKSRFPDKGF